MIQIEKGVPFPVVRAIPASKYPFDEMEVGDSFVVTATLGTVRAACVRHAKGTDKKFTARSADDKTVRVWRIK